MKKKLWINGTRIHLTLSEIIQAKNVVERAAALVLESFPVQHFIHNIWAMEIHPHISTLFPEVITLPTFSSRQIFSL